MVAVVVVLLWRSREHDGVGEREALVFGGHNTAVDSFLPSYYEVGVNGSSDTLSERYDTARK